MPGRPPQSPSHSSDYYTYVPAAAQQAMARQMQQAVPAHLKQYVGNERPAYIPPQVQRELTTYMQKAAPEHLKQYAGAFVEQNIMSKPGSTGTRPMTARPPVPDKRNLSHSGEVAAAQANAAQYLGMFQPDTPSSAVPPQATPPPNSSYEQPSQSPHPDFDFIMNPQQPKRPGLFSFGGSSTLFRALVVGGGVVVLLVLFAVIKGVLAGNNKSIPSMVSLVQQQQGLISIAADGTQNATSADSKNFAYTTQLSLQSQQQQLVDYLKNNGRKVGKKELALGVSKDAADQLSNAKTAGNYDPTFKELMQSRLSSYQQLLKQAFAQTKGSKGRALLQGDFKAAELLSKQFGS